MKNTKGKWTWIADEHSVPSIYKSDDLTFRIAKLWGNTPKDRQIANLIASAPDLLRAIKPLVKRIKAEDSWAKDYNQIKFAEEAIAKAEGK